MKTIRFWSPTSWVIMLLCLSCSNVSNKNQQSAELGTVNTPKDTIQVKKATVEYSVIERDSILLKTRLDSITNLFSDLGFNREEDVNLSKLKQYRKHWWLKRYRPEVLGKTAAFPTKQDFDKVKLIKQFIFKKVWKYHIEQWRFDSVADAKRWFEIAKYAHHKEGSYYLEKPPNDFWLEGDKLYIIMATAARDWFEHSEKIIKEFSDMDKIEVRKMRE